MLHVTKTLHPLPFEHLEPKRFEDLVRQLAYDFRPWRQLEATGRGGSDDGYDARAFEITHSAALQEDDDLTDEPSPPISTDRLWLIQCKRERQIGPANLRSHLDAIPPASLEHLHGIIFAAACNFSKSAFDTFRTWCREKGIQECYLWGVAAIEDFLYQPQNDHLLFAYFGISLRMRRQKFSSALRRNISLKRRLARCFEDKLFGRPILLRDPADDKYPSTDADSLKKGLCQWLPCYSTGVAHNGLRIVARRHLAFFDEEQGRWDFATGVNEAVPPESENPWNHLQAVAGERNLRGELTSFWWSLPKRCQWHIMFTSPLPYEEIIEIDDIGDDLIKFPTVYTSFRNGTPPLDEWTIELHPVDPYRNWIEFHAEGHAKVFPDKFRDTAWELEWYARNQIAYSRDAFEMPPPDAPNLFEP